VLKDFNTQGMILSFILQNEVIMSMTFDKLLTYLHTLLLSYSFSCKR